MKRGTVLAAAVLLAGLVHVVLAETPGNLTEKDRAALQQKMLGAWKGQTGCAGSFRFRADGTYELTEFGPAPYDSAGTWRVRSDTLPATLFLTCKTSEIPDEVGTTREVTLIRLDDESLAVMHGSQTVERYARVKQ
jgi:hypothetical protein